MSWADHPTASDDEMDASPDTGDPDTETSDTPEQSASEPAVLELVREESRAVLDEQIELLREIDEKATETARIAILIVGLVVSVGRPSDPAEVSATVGRLGAVGVAFLLVSLLTATYTYTVSDVEFGVGEGHRTEVRQESFTRREWLSFQLDEYDEWTAELAATNQRNARLLHLAVVTLILGILALVGAVSLDHSGVLGATDIINRWIATAVAVGVLLPVTKN